MCALRPSDGRGNSLRTINTAADGSVGCVNSFIARLFRLLLPLTDMYKDAHVSHLSVHGIDHHRGMSKIPIPPLLKRV